MTLAKFGLLLHAIFAFGAVAMMTHLWLWSLKGERAIGRLHLHTKWAAALYVAAFGLGSTLYPTFRTTARVHFDSHLPWATALFEVKEHLASMNLALVVLIVAIGPTLWSSDKKAWRAGKWLTGTSAAILWYSGLTGAVLTLLRPI